MPEGDNTRTTVSVIAGIRRLAQRRRIGLLIPALGLLAAGVSAPALAQYKWLGPDGTVSYGDRPPPGARPFGQDTATPPLGRSAGEPVRSNAGTVANTKAGTTAALRPAADAGAAPATAGLPYELRLAAQRHPVTLFTTADCEPCIQARTHLDRRGIPFATREVRTNEDAEAFRALGFADLSFPALRIGNDRRIGFDANGWDRALDAAGYPKTSQMPPRWQAPRSEPLGRPVASPQAAAPSPATPAVTDDVAADPRSDDAASVPTRRTRSSSAEQPTIRF